MAVAPDDTFGRLTTIRREGRIGTHKAWLCRCACGVEKTILEGSLLRGRSRSCGCLARELRSERLRVHGMSGTPEYQSWRDARNRVLGLVTDPTTLRNYKDRGITMCPEWVSSFDAFYAHVGPSPAPGYTIERIDNDRGYEPGNVRWATRKEQGRNRRDNVFYDHAGKSMLLVDWARELGVAYKMLASRIRRGWTIAETLSTPKRGGEGWDRTYEHVNPGGHS
jgi:hypothetical protein